MGAGSVRNRGCGMSAKNNTHPTAATVERAWQETACEARLSFVNPTTPPARRQHEIISGVIPCGRENAIKLPQVAQLLDTDSRTARLMIQRARRSVPVLSDNASGYWISNDPNEVGRFSESMRRRARQIYKTAANVEKAAGLTRHEPQQLDGQGCIWAGGDGDG